jgi:hypothetical protein
MAVQFMVVQATDWNGVLVANFAAERTPLSEANVVRFAQRPAAYQGCCCYENSRTGAGVTWAEPWVPG